MFPSQWGMHLSSSVTLQVSSVAGALPTSLLSLPSSSSSSAILSPDGKGIFLFYVMHTPSCKGDCGIGTGYVVSVDGGLSWSEPCDISSGIGPAAGALPGPGAGVTIISSGRMMFAAHHSAYVRDYVVYSDDKGVTWRCLNQSFPSMDEPALAVMANGSVQLNMRHKLARERGRAVSWSHDGGNNFGPIQYASALISPVCEASMATITTGSGITSTFFANPASTTGRDHISVRRTSDSGGTWTKAPYLVQAAPTFGYTALLSRPLLRGSLPEGGLLFESVNATIAFTAFPLDF